jgi:hypothetical protein
MEPETYELEMMKLIIRVMTVELIDCGGTTPKATCEVVARDHPKLYAAIGKDRVLALCREIHESSDPVESARLQKVFVKFNAQYFSGQLDGFIVLAVYSAGAGANLPASHWFEPLSGRVDFLNRHIHVALACGYWMPAYLLRFMAHASTVMHHGTKAEWLIEMQRLCELGAPVEIEVP